MISVSLDYQVAVVTLVMVAKFCVAGSFSVIYLYTAELYLTVIRSDDTSLIFLPGTGIFRFSPLHQHHHHHHHHHQLHTAVRARNRCTVLKLSKFKFSKCRGSNGGDISHQNSSCKLRLLCTIQFHWL